MFSIFFSFFQGRVEELHVEDKGRAHCELSPKVIFSISVPISRGE